METDSCNYNIQQPDLDKTVFDKRCRRAVTYVFKQREVLDIHFSEFSREFIHKSLFIKDTELCGRGGIIIVGYNCIDAFID